LLRVSSICELLLKMNLSIEWITLKYVMIGKIFYNLLPNIHKIIKKKNLLKIKNVHALNRFFFSENSKKHAEHFDKHYLGYRMMYLKKFYL